MVTSLMVAVTEPIRRKDNMVADYMANIGVKMHEQFRIQHPRDPLIGGIEEQIQRNYQDDMIVWREEMEHTG